MTQKSNPIKIICRYIQKNKGFFITAAEKQKLVLKWINRKHPELRKIVDEFGENFYAVLKEAKDTREKMGRDDPFDCFISLTRSVDVNPEQLAYFLHSNAAILDFFKKNLKILQPVITKWNEDHAQRTRFPENLNQSPKPPTPQTICSLAEYLFQNKYAFIGTVIEFIANKTPSLNMIYYDWLKSSEEHETEIIRNKSTQKAIIDPFIYHLTKLIFFASDVFSTRPQSIIDYDEDLAKKFILSVLNLSSNNTDSLNNLLSEHKDIAQFLKNWLPKVHPALTKQKNNNLLITDEIEENLDDHYLLLFANELTDDATQTAVSFVKKHAFIIFTLLCSKLLDALTKNQPDLLKQQIKNVLHLKQQCPNVLVDDFCKKFNDAIAKISKSEKNLPRETILMHFAQGIMDILLQNNEADLKMYLANSGGELVEVIAKNANTLDPLFSEWEKHLGQQTQSSNSKKYSSSNKETPSAPSTQGTNTATLVANSRAALHADMDIAAATLCSMETSPLIIHKKRQTYDASLRNMKGFLDRLSTDIVEDTDQIAKKPRLSE